MSLSSRRRAPRSPLPRASLTAATRAQDEAGAADFVRQLGLGLEQALVAHARRFSEPPRRHHVASAALVRARPYYGYHQGDELFVRVALLNPGEVTRAANVLAERVVLNRAFEVHESHVPFILQVMMDLNVAGMALLSLQPERVVFRGELPAQPLLHQRVEPQSGEPALAFAAAEEAPAPEVGSGASVQTAGPLVRLWLCCPARVSGSLTHGALPQMWTRACAQAGRAQCSAAVARQTTCELEADALAMDVLNRSDALRVPLDRATPDMQLVQSMAPLWAEEKLRAAAAGLPQPRRATSPERAPPGAESEAVQHARAALRCCTARCAIRDACSRVFAVCVSQGRCPGRASARARRQRGVCCTRAGVAAG